MNTDLGVQHMNKSKELPSILNIQEWLLSMDDELGEYGNQDRATHKKRKKKKGKRKKDRSRDGGRRAGWQFYCRAIWLKGNGFVVVVVFASCVIFTKATRLPHIPQLSNGFDILVEFETYTYPSSSFSSISFFSQLILFWFLGQGRKCCKMLTDSFLSP